MSEFASNFYIVLLPDGLGSKNFHGQIKKWNLKENLDKLFAFILTKISDISKILFNKKLPVKRKGWEI